VAEHVGASQGWARAFPSARRSPKRHFFRSGDGLCDRMLSPAGPLEVSDVPAPNDCKHCRRKRDAEMHPTLPFDDTDDVG
jgi:hypothetical protein